MKINLPLDDEAIFYLEQWAALLIGAGCLGMSLWAGVHGYGTDASTLLSLHRHLNTANKPMIALSWSLTISVALIGVVLVRFAFRRRSEAKNAQPDHTEPSPRGDVAGAVAHIANSAAISSGRR